MAYLAAGLVDMIGTETLEIPRFQKFAELTNKQIYFCNWMMDKSVTSKIP
jgi:hypothetical protein